MNEQIKTQLTTAYMMFVFDFSDPSQIDKDHFTKSINLEELFDTQRTADKAKRLWGKDGFKKLMSLYFNRYQTNKGLDFDALEASIVKNRKVFLRHLGKDKIAFLLLIVTLLKALESTPTKRGLLFQRTSA